MFIKSPEIIFTSLNIGVKKYKIMIKRYNDFLEESKKDDKDVKQESKFTSKEKEKIEKFVSDYKGDFEDTDIHDFADKIGLDKHEVEEYIYSLARKGVDEEKSEEKKGFKTDIEKDTLDNKDFRKVLYTGEHLQLVLMTLKPGEEIGLEVHPTIDQFFRFEEGKGKCIINSTEYDVEDGDAIIIPSGSEHNIINTSDKEDFKMYTIYTPPHHKDGIEFKTKEESEKSKEEFDGEITEE